MVDYSIFPLDEEIKDKLAKLEISYAFQPIFYPDGKDIYAYEALMRPKNIGVMDLIEEFRIKNDLHTLEVATIFGAVQCYAKRGYHSYIAINSFPAESFTAEEQAVFDEFYADVLGDKGIIEILEYTALDIDKWQSKKNSINRSRFNIALDDFGTGYSNLHCLSDLKPNYIKIDRTFTLKALRNKYDYKLMTYIIDMAHSLGLKLCIEGVETKGEMEKIKSMCPNFFQGYFFGRPCPYEDFVSQFVKNKK